jgi:xanthine dehydrogenase YagS FAD-binding subunit
MKSFQYVTPQSTSSAIQLARDKGRFIAGGIDVLGEMKEYISQPKTLVNIKDLAETKDLGESNGGWTIGANVTISDLVNHTDFAKKLPGLHQAARNIGSLQIRNVATVGGNLAQHSRCWYYRQRDITCLKRGGDLCYARDGENKYHALFSGCGCISPVVSNLSIALSALRAIAVVQRDAKTARLSIPEVYDAAWSNPKAHHSLSSTDLILKIEVPNYFNRSAYLQMSEKSDFDWALVSCAAALKIDGSEIQDGEIFLGAVAPIPFTSKAANALLKGKQLNEELATKVADTMLAGAQPFADNAYKVPVAHALIRRTLLSLL